MNRVDARFPSMGTEASVRLESDVVAAEDLERHAAGIRARLEEAEAALTRFDAGSELSALNRDPRAAVPASPLVRALARAARWAGERSGGLVDATLLGPLEAAGYGTSRAGLAPAALDDALDAAPPRRPAAPHPARAFAPIQVAGRAVLRPPGTRLDSGGLGKGLAADLAAASLPAGVRYAISCGGDLAVGGAERSAPWEVAVTDARTGVEAHRLRVRAGGIATSGIHARLWRRRDGAYAHHVLDPATGRPAWTGLVAASAVAANALEAEVLAKTALLAGPGRARELLRRRGGVLQHDDGRIEIVAAARVVRVRRPGPKAVAA